VSGQGGNSVLSAAAWPSPITTLRRRPSVFILSRMTRGQRSIFAAEPVGVGQARPSLFICDLIASVASRYLSGEHAVIPIFGKIHPGLVVRQPRPLNKSAILVGLPL
jgi:hypothetical protein